MLNTRGTLVVLLFSAVSLCIGWNAGAFRHDLMWRADWTRLQMASVGALCKGDRVK